MRLTLKIVGIVFVLLSSFLFGYCKALTFKKRVLELKRILEGTLRLKEYVSNCPAEIESIYKSCYGPCNDIEFVNGKIVVKQDNLFKEDCELLKEFFATLGALDLNSECARISLYSELLKKQITAAESNSEQESKIWQTCSICVGIGISILII